MREHPDGVADRADVGQGQLGLVRAVGAGRHGRGDRLGKFTRIGDTADDRLHLDVRGRQAVQVGVSTFGQWPLQSSTPIRRPTKKILWKFAMNQQWAAVSRHKVSISVKTGFGASRRLR